MRHPASKNLKIFSFFSQALTRYFIFRFQLAGGQPLPDERDPVTCLVEVFNLDVRGNRRDNFKTFLEDTRTIYWNELNQGIKSENFRNLTLAEQLLSRLPTLTSDEVKKLLTSLLKRM